MTGGDSSAEIIDQIYEAAFIPEKWSNTIDILAERSEAASGSVLVFTGYRPPRFRSTELTHQALTDFCSGDGWKNSQRAPFMIEALPSTFLCDADYLTAEQMERDSVSQSLSTLGLGWQLGTAIPMPERSMVNFTFERRIDDGRHSAAQIAMLNDFRPHLARAGLLAARLGLERARNAAATLEHLGLPTYVLSRSGSVIAVNALAEAMSSVLRPAARGMLATTDLAANELLQHAISHAGSSRQPFVHSIPLRATADRGPMILHLVPLRRDANDIFSQASSLLIVTSVSVTNPATDGKILDALFDLSPSEARLALALASGSTLKQAATQGGIQLSTARSYLESIFRKTGAHQQSQLVALLKSAQPLARRP